jgi:hypothetical protein
MMKKLISYLIAIVAIILISIVLTYRLELDKSFIGVFGALISYIFTDYQKRAQRSFEMKKAIYFEASESLSKMRAFIGNIQTIDLKIISADANIINGLQKLDFIAKIELIKKLNECSHYYRIAIQEMMLDRIEIDFLNNNAQYSLDRSSEYLESMKIKGCENSYSDLHENINNKRFTLAEKSIKYSVGFNNLLIDCILIMREDIGNGFNENDKNFYKKLVAESDKKALEGVIKFLEIIKKKVESEIRSFNSRDL